MGKSKLLKLKKWLTIPEAARHLSNLFEEEVSEADVLRLALDRHLKLSVYFVNHTYARQGAKFLPFEEWNASFKKEISWEELKPIVRSDGYLSLSLDGHDVSFPVSLERIKDKSLLASPKGVKDYLVYDEKLKKAFWDELSSEEQSQLLRIVPEYIIDFAMRQSEEFGRVPPGSNTFKGDVVSIKGVWDFPMIGAERLDIEHEYQQRIGGPEVTLQSLDGAFVEGDDFAIWQLQESFDENEFQPGSSAQLEQIKQFIAENDIGKPEAEKLLEDHEKKREEYLENKRKKDHSHDFYPAGGLPRDSVLVVRTSALLDLQGGVSEEQAGGKTPSTLNPSERKSLVKMVYAMAVDCYGYNPDDKKSPVTQDILEAISKADLSISPDTVRKWLKEGAALSKDDF